MTELTLFEFCAKYGPEGLFVGAIIFIALRFDDHLTKRDERDAEFKKKYLESVEKHTSAFTELSVLVKQVLGATKEG